MHEPLVPGLSPALSLSRSVISCEQPAGTPLRAPRWDEVKMGEKGTVSALQTPSPITSIGGGGGQVGMEGKGEFGDKTS